MYRAVGEPVGNVPENRARACGAEGDQLRNDSAGAWQRRQQPLARLLEIYIRKEQAPELRKLAPEIAPELAARVHRMLGYDPAQRPAMSAVKEELGQLLRAEEDARLERLTAARVAVAENAAANRAAVERAALERRAVEQVAAAERAEVAAEERASKEKSARSRSWRTTRTCR